MFDPTSRYAGIDDARLTVIGPDGAARVLVYKRRRFLPPPGDGTPLVDHTVTEGERLDSVTDRYLGDPTQFWRLGDANDVMHPAELEEVGRVLRIALPRM